MIFGMVANEARQPSDHPPDNRESAQVQVDHVTKLIGFRSENVEMRRFGSKYATQLFQTSGELFICA